MLELKNNIFYVGVKDPTLRTFDIFMKTEPSTIISINLTTEKVVFYCDTSVSNILGI